jgi:hypothetical protein
MDILLIPEVQGIILGAAIILIGISAGCLAILVLAKLAR